MIWNIFRYTGGIKRSNRDNPDFIYIILKVFVHKRTIKHAFLPTKSALLPVVIKFQRSAQLNTYLCSFLLLFIKTTFDKTLLFSPFNFLIWESRFGICLRTSLGLGYKLRVSLCNTNFFCSSKFIHNAIKYHFYCLT